MRSRPRAVRKDALRDQTADEESHYQLETSGFFHSSSIPPVARAPPLTRKLGNFTDFSAD